LDNEDEPVITLWPDVLDDQTNHGNSADGNQGFGRLETSLCKAASRSSHRHDNIQHGKIPFCYYRLGIN
jgi:hypothetical protein